MTMLDHTVSRELERVAPRVHVTSPSKIAAAGPNAEDLRLNFLTGV